ncbi:oligosaccharide flippase family protein [Qipengyuania zhejiangensis]|uniref:oligosaccharide flippase family protein n=1 Tax=Qipengyuania zhejiangensis TaxID=3077782 RepID=UPI002D79A004|nr:oligosaccharide flippase family protein [Qipengyuania sp. Z2]
MDKSILRSSGGTTIAKAAQAGLGLLTALVLARVFGAEIFGIFAYATATAMLVSIFTRLGFHVQIIYAMNRAITQKREGDIATIVATGLIASLAASIAGGSLLYSVLFFVPEWQMAPALKFSAALVVVSALVQIIGGAITAMGKVVLGVSVESVFKPVLFLIGVGIVLLGASPEEIGYDGLLQVFIVSQTLLVAGSTAVLFYWIRKSYGPLRWRRCIFWPGVREAQPFMLANAMLRLYQEAGLVAVGIFFLPVDVALFRIAAQTSALIPFGLQALQAVFRPRIARRYADGPAERRELQRELTHMTRLLAVLESPLILALIFLSPLVGWIFGEEFAAAATLLTILSVGQAYSILCGLNGDVLNMTGRANIAARWAIIALVLVVAFMWPFIQIFGLAGAALAVCVTRLIWNTALVLAAVRHTGLHTTVAGRLAVLERVTGRAEPE